MTDRLAGATLAGVMASPLRVEYPGAAYRVMARGHQGRANFNVEQDRQRFLETLGEARDQTGWRLHACVPMGNHSYLLIETRQGNLVAGIGAGMKRSQGTYTQRYNRRREVLGHLFQGRYKAVPVEASNAGYLEAVSTHIHLHPVRAGLIEAGMEKVQRCRWNSHPNTNASRPPRKRLRAGLNRFQQSRAKLRHLEMDGMAK